MERAHRVEPDLLDECPRCADLPALLELTTANEPRTAADLALRLLARPASGTLLLARGRLWPGGRKWSLPANVRAEALATGRQPLDGTLLPPGHSPTDRLEVLTLTDDVFLLRALDGAPALGPFACLIGAIVDLALARHDDRRPAGGDGDDRFLAQFGRFALPLNHDLRNPLCAIMLNAHLLLEAGLSDDATTARVRAIVDNSERIRADLERLADVKRELRADAARGGVEI